jgi:pseudouridine-5'-phosphate glycosidase
MPLNLAFHPDVRAAQQKGAPVVALETTVITHGMAYPDNLEIALGMQAAVRDAGAVPATLGIVDGAVSIGLTDSQIEAFARAPRDRIAKCSRRDLPMVLAHGSNGSLTVAGTMVVAAVAGIPIMATGGIGGVHRGHPYDVSADLTELGRTPVAVVCSGAKSILDLPLTLEMLETQGVPVVGVGTPNLPAFYSRDSGLTLPGSVDDVVGAARVYRVWHETGMDNGLLLTVPVPVEAALPASELEAIIERAVADADEQGISGGWVTPFVLSRVVELTGGRSMAANKALLLNNASVAAAIAAMQHSCV